MIKQVIQYDDLEGNQVVGEFWFHLNEAEILEMDTETEGTLTARIQRMTNGQDQTKVMSTLRDLVWRACGEKSSDGRRFLKTPEAKSAFMDSDAYSKFVLRLLTNSTAAVDFVNGIMPKNIKETAEKMSQQDSVPTAATVSTSTLTSVPESPLSASGFSRPEFPGFTPEQNKILAHTPPEAERDWSDWRNYTRDVLLDMDDDMFEALGGKVKPGMDKILMGIAFQRRERASKGGA